MLVDRLHSHQLLAQLVDSKINSSKSSLSKHLPDSVELTSSLHWLLKLVEADFDLLDQVMFLLRPGSHVVVHCQASHV